MFGWRSLATVRASCRKRSRKGRLAASSGEMTLIATCLSSVGSRARKTLPIPPAPSCRSTSYWPASAVRRDSSRSGRGAVDIWDKMAIQPPKAKEERLPGSSGAQAVFPLSLLFDLQRGLSLPPRFLRRAEHLLQLLVAHPAPVARVVGQPAAHDAVERFEGEPAVAVGGE